MIGTEAWLVQLLGTSDSHVTLSKEDAQRIISLYRNSEYSRNKYHRDLMERGKNLEAMQQKIGSLEEQNKNLVSDEDRPLWRRITNQRRVIRGLNARMESVFKFSHSQWARYSELARARDRYKKMLVDILHITGGTPGDYADSVTWEKYLETASHEDVVRIVQDNEQGWEELTDQLEKQLTS